MSEYSLKPKTMAKIVPKIFAMTYIIPFSHCEDFKKVNASSPKVEKVVYPPQIPIIQNALKSSSLELSCICLMQIPIKRAPVKLTNNVGQGKNPRKKYPTIALRVEPIPPPNPTKR